MNSKQDEIKADLKRMADYYGLYKPEIDHIAISPVAMREIRRAPSACGCRWQGGVLRYGRYELTLT